MGDRSKDNSSSLVPEKLISSNSKRKIGVLGLAQADENGISMVQVKLQTSKQNNFGMGLHGSIGKISLSKPVSMNKKMNTLTIMNIGFNTFSGGVGLKIYRLQLNVTGYLGGISAKAQLGKTGGLGISFGIGAAINWNWNND